MSKPAPKKEETAIFSIDTNPFEDGAIPGVTQLLSRNPPPKPSKPVSLQATRTEIPLPAAPMKNPEGINILIPNAPEVTRTNTMVPSEISIALDTASAADNVTRTNLVVASNLQLKDLGVLFELKFHAEGSVFRYASVFGHKEPRLLSWQEKIFDRMKMDKQSVPAVEPFEEFTSAKNPFLFDAFGAQSQHFIQIVSPEYTNTRVVLISDQSVASQAAAILEHYSKG